MLLAALQATLTLHSCFPNFPSASHLIMFVKRKQATQDEEHKAIAQYSRKSRAYVLLLCRTEVHEIAV